VSRGKLEPGNLKSLLMWLARNADTETRIEIVKHALYADADYVHNKPRKERAAKKAAKSPRKKATASKNGET
jgi:hypothetical protein